VAAGESRRLTVTFPVALRADGTAEPLPVAEGGAAAKPVPRSGPPALAWVAGAVGLAALGSFTIFEILGQNAYTNLKNDCAAAHACAQADVDAAQTKFIVAGVSLGVAAVAAGAAAWLFLAPGDTPKTSAPAPRARLGIAPVPGGAAGDLIVAF
jgi:hypothetical protein